MHKEIEDNFGQDIQYFRACHKTYFFSIMGSLNVNDELYLKYAAALI